MENEIKERLTRRSVWVRALFMLFYAIAYGIAEFLLWTVAIIQFLFVLIAGRVNDRLLQFGNNLSAYLYQILRFLTFNSEAQPFPFSDWPDEPIDDNLWADEAHAPQPPKSDED